MRLDVDTQRRMVSAGAQELRHGSSGQGRMVPELHYAARNCAGKNTMSRRCRSTAQRRWRVGEEAAQEIALGIRKPAIASLERARSLQSDTPRYWKRSSASNQNDWDRSLTLIEDVQKIAPWL